MRPINLRVAPDIVTILRFRLNAKDPRKNTEALLESITKILSEVLVHVTISKQTIEIEA